MRLYFWLHSIIDCLKKNHELAKWAKENGYSGIKHYGAHDIVGGVTAEPYVNLIIFEQATLDAALNGVTPLPTNWRFK